MENLDLATISSKEKIWLAALVEVAHELKTAGIAYFLDTGTLLGCVRDGAFIPWDNDIDIGVVDCEHDDPFLAHLVRRLCAKGFVVNISNTGVGLFSASAVEVNIKFYRREKHLLVGDYSHYSHDSRLFTFLYNVSAGHHASSHGRRIGYRIKAAVIAARPIWRELLLPWLSKGVSYNSLVAKVPADAVFPLKSICFYGLQFSAPGDCRAYLGSRYGSNWEIPVRHYDYTKDDLSISAGPST